MSSDSSGEFDEIAERITEDRGALLTALSRSDQNALSTTDLRRQTDIPSGSMNYHMDELEQLGLVEVVGQTEGSGRIPANVYSITELGQSFLESKSWQSFPSMEYVRRLEERIDGLEQTVQEMQDKHEKMVDILEQMQSS
ncbi:putative transcriptional regulator (plasmid) [Haloterrigena turkmenica DSM 5511]|uniref:Transcriptional regulator n=1 Tax=Haloterrigena turkmenica (strain ATCC 51198 / DSM 5511 / JCM 9101 / NCIMB 13204 / VKM B-1734 / 4k) TaxID=543526 RepID=D2S0D2_HALTV|nr:helix-turn-helix domain-containing protein [Haloterrigena turkmenica]ADB62829.1 putative transcriptional regulator [Haloterrigena turkmenica DSM 5511]